MKEIQEISFQHHPFPQIITALTNLYQYLYSDERHYVGIPSLYQNRCPSAVLKKGWVPVNAHKRIVVG